MRESRTSGPVREAPGDRRLYPTLFEGLLGGFHPTDTPARGVPGEDPHRAHASEYRAGMEEGTMAAPRERMGTETGKGAALRPPPPEVSTATPSTSFKLVSVLLEQMAYKTNPHCQYPTS